MSLDNLTTETETLITNLCTCRDEDGLDVAECEGWCWDDTVEMFDQDLDEWFTPGTFRIEGFPTWHGPVAGYFEAATPLDFLAAITPERTDWYLRYKLPVAGQPFTGIMSHHDGSGQVIVTYAPELDQ